MSFYGQISIVDMRGKNLYFAEKYDFLVLIELLFCFITWSNGEGAPNNFKDALVGKPINLVSADIFLFEYLSKLRIMALLISNCKICSMT